MVMSLGETMHDCELVQAVAEEVVRRLEAGGAAFASAEPEYVTLAEVARRTSFSYDYVYDAVRRGDLLAAKKGKDWRVRLIDMREWMSKGRPKAATVGRPDMQKKVQRLMPGLSA
jgi:excisionase family DNA binding protein